MLKVKEENTPMPVFDLNIIYSRSQKAIRKLLTSSRSWLWATRRTEIGTQRNVQAQCKCSKMKQQQQQTSTIINDSQILKYYSKIFNSRALKAKKDLELTDCVAEVDKFSACNDKGKERFVDAKNKID